MNDASTYRELVALFDNHGATDSSYLTDHYQRFATTLAEFRAGWTHEGSRVLDIGAHWLHQSVIWRQAGFVVNAVDLPDSFDMECVKSIARAMDIPLFPCADLEQADALRDIADESMDVVLFTEILEHITFNPIKLWQQVYRVLAPNGRIVVTTPNYYSWRGRAWRPLRFLAGYGGGISVDEVLNQHTYSHHWREYSRREVLCYFHLLSPDFVPVKARLMPTYMYSKMRWKSGVQQALDLLPLLRPNLHVELALPVKRHGIVASASW